MAFRFIGVSSTAITDGGSQAPTINGQTWSTSNLLNGDTCMYNYGRFMWNTSTGKWVGQGDVNIHSDVQSALNDIIVANKGEEVRGSIYDALALMDARSIMIEDDIIDNMDPIIAREVENISGAYLGQVAMTIELDSQTHTGTCSLFPIAIQGHVSDGKVLVTKLIYDSEERHCVTTRVREDSGTTLYLMTYSILDSSTIEFITMMMPTPNEGTISQYNRVLVPISGGGSSYTEGDGIDIANDEISVKLRSSNPGLAFDSNGNLYATGGGGSYTNGNGIDITNNVISVSPKNNGGITVDSTGVSVDTSKIQAKLTAGTNITIDNTDPANPVISSTGGGNSLAVKIFHLNVSGTPTINHTYNEISSVIDGALGDIPIYLWHSDDTHTFTSSIGSCTHSSGSIIFKFFTGDETHYEYREYILTSEDVLTLDSRATYSIQPKLSSANAGTGISITYDALGNPVISLDLPQAEGGGF